MAKREEELKLKNKEETIHKIAILSLKGGVGKTTIALNLGAALSRLGKRVLLVDLDPNNDLTLNLGLEPTQIKGVEYFITADIPFEGVVVNCQDNLDILPAGKRLKEQEISLYGLYKKEPEYSYNLLKQAFEQSDIHYDFIIVDCAPNAGILNHNSLVFAENILIPIQCHNLAVHGSQRTVFFVHKIKVHYNSNLRIIGVVPSMFDRRNKLSEKVLAELKAAYNNLVTETIIRVNIALAEAPAFGKPIFDYRANSRGAEDFTQLATELLQKL
ncbi:MAG: sporulation initiation inhibitor protein Soj [Calditrichia bacterium]